MPEGGLDEQNIRMPLYFSIIECKKYVATSLRTPSSFELRSQSIPAGWSARLTSRHNYDKLSIMTEWKSSFERGISGFRSGKYKEALACFNEV